MRQKHLLFSTLIACTFTCLFIGCDELASSETQAPPLATLSGLIEVPEGIKPPEGDLKLALVWYPTASEFSKTKEPPEYPFESGSCSDSGCIYTDYAGSAAQQVDLEPKFPARFKLNITEPPPQEVLFPRPDGIPGVWAFVGTLVLYKDTNHNGKLDKSSLGRTSKDVILGNSEFTELFRIGNREKGEGFEIVYSDAPMRVDRTLDLDAGYTLFRQKMWDFGCRGDSITKVDLGTEISISVSENPKLQQVICDERREVKDDSFVCPASASELPRGSCTWDFSGSSGVLVEASLSWSGYTCEGCSCKVAQCEYKVKGDETSTIPADWPCSEKFNEELANGRYGTYGYGC
jgi:hypothetical protein